MTASRGRALLGFLLAALVAAVLFPASGAPLRRLLFLGSFSMACALTLWLFLRETHPREKRQMAGA